ncbi:MAG: hypothetical protein Hals2KO_15300 [Halioglobus sp.]
MMARIYQVVFALWIITSPSLLWASDTELHFAAGVTAGIRDIDFELNNSVGEVKLQDMSGNTIAIVSPPGEVRLNLEETLYNFGFWGSVSFDRIYAKALVELAPTENANILVSTDNFSEFDPEEPWKNELEREDYSLTVGFDAGYGFSLFGGYKYTKFQANGLDYNFILGSKDTRYTEEGVFLGGSYEWVFDNRMSVAFSVAYAFLDLEFGDVDLNSERDVGRPITFGEYNFGAVGRGLSAGLQWTVPVTERWFFGAAAKYQNYESDSQTTVLEVNTIDPATQIEPVVISNAKTDHTDVIISIGAQYLF